MSTLQKGFTAIKIALTIALVSGIGAAGYFAYHNSQQAPKPISSTSSKPITVSLGAEFTLHEGQTAKVGDTGLEVTVLKFYNSPCPPKGQCIWSGVGVGLQYRLGAETKEGIDLVRAFGYRTEIIKTDYKTYATLKVY